MYKIQKAGTFLKNFNWIFLPPVFSIWMYQKLDICQQPRIPVWRFARLHRWLGWVQVRFPDHRWQLQQGHHCWSGPGLNHYEQHLNNNFIKIYLTFISLKIIKILKNTFFLIIKSSFSPRTKTTSTCLLTWSSLTS